MNKYLKLPVHMRKKNPVLAELREQLLRKMLLVSFAVGSILFVLALIPTLQRGLYLITLVDLLLYAWIILITFLKHMPYRVRAIGLLGVLYGLGCIILATTSFNMAAGLFFLMFIVMTILLLDWPGGLVALIFISVAIIIMALFNVIGQYQLPIEPPQSSLMPWILSGITLFSSGVLLIYSLEIIVNGMGRNLSKATLLSRQLEQMNQSLRLSEARYRTLVETSPGLVAMLDLDGNILTVNQVGLTLFGYGDQEDMVGKNVLAFIAPLDQSRVLHSFQRTLQGGPPNDLACQGIRKDGTIFIAEFNATLVKDGAGKPQSVIVIGKDITERKAQEQVLQEDRAALALKVAETRIQLELASNRLEELVRSGPAVIYSLRASDYAVTYLSENITAILGYQAQDFMQGPDFWRSHIHPEDMLNLIPRMELERDKEKVTYELRLLKKDGKYCWVHGESKLIRDPQGNPLEYTGSLVDITELKNKEDTLGFFQDQYRSLYESMIDAYIDVDMDGHIQKVNLALLTMLGYSSEELHEMTFQDLTPLKWREFEQGIIRDQIIPRGHSDIYEKEYLRKDGSIIPVELNVVLTRDGAGRPSGMWAIVRDISERKKIEQALRESEERSRNLLDSSMQGVIVYQDREVVYVNNALTETLGYELTGRKSLASDWFSLMIHPEERPMFLDRLQQCMKGIADPERFSMRIFDNDCRIHWLESRILPIMMHGMPAMMVTFIDVTEIRQAQAELQENAKTLQTIIDAMDALVFMVDTKTALIAANHKFASRTGLKADILDGTVLRDLFPVKIYQARKVYFDQAINSGNPVYFMDENRGTWFENSFYPIKDASEKVARVVVIARDITEQRRLTEALRVSEEKYRTLAETAHDVIFIINRDGHLMYVNSFGANYFQLKPQQMEGQRLSDFFPSVNWEDILSQFHGTREAVSLESEMNFPTGSAWFSSWLVPMKDASGEIISVLGVARDISKRKKAEEALQQARIQLEERVAERTRELSASREQLRMLTAQIVHTQEEERRSISRELHDEAGQALITLKYDLAAIQDELPAADTRIRKRILDSMGIIDQTTLHIRELAHSLRPPVLEIGGINLSLQDHCQELSGRTRIPISYQGMEIPGLPDEVGISLFRFVQEALTNIMKHAGATRVNVRLQYRKGEISLSVVDNGRGIVDADQKKGLGLLGISERLHLIGGRLEILSPKKGGTKLIAHVPWTKALIK